MDVLDYVLPVHDQRGVAWKSQCGVQHRAILRDVDVYAGEHLVATLLELGGAGQVGQQLQGFPVDAVFAVVDVEVADGDVEFAAAVWVLGEEFTQVGAHDLVVVLAQRLPCRGR